jgi:hypothetical protein
MYSEPLKSQMLGSHQIVLEVNRFWIVAVRSQTKAVVQIFKTVYPWQFQIQQNPLRRLRCCVDQSACQCKRDSPTIPLRPEQLLLR